MSIEDASPAQQPLKAVRDFVDERLCALAKNPDGWGSPGAVELQMLQLVEVYLVAAGWDVEHAHLTPRRWYGHAALRYPGPPSTLASRMGLGKEASPEFIQELAGFIEKETGINCRREKP